jgi:hypothetical protein
MTTIHAIAQLQENTHECPAGGEHSPITQFQTSRYARTHTHTHTHPDTFAELREGGEISLLNPFSSRQFQGRTRTSPARRTLHVNEKAKKSKTGAIASHSSRSLLLGYH